jgi:hypothetical protein
MRSARGRATAGRTRPESTAQQRNPIGLIACGALAREVLALKERHDWPVDLHALPALLHNEPERITDAVVGRIRELRPSYTRLIVVYGDCGTGGTLDRALQDEEVQRVAGPHCYEMYADGSFDSMMEQAPGTFFLTDYLLQSFDHLVLEGLGIDRNPELCEAYFRNYTRVVYLAQRGDQSSEARARWAAEQLGLPLEIKQVGYGALERRLKELIEA